MHLGIRWVWLLYIIATGGIAPGRAEPHLPAPPGKALAPAIGIRPTAGCNLAILDEPVPGRVVVALTTPAHNWFAGTFTHLPTDQATTIGLSMTGNNTKGNVGDVRKWQGLRPVMTYADPTSEAAYRWYRKNAQGRWIAGDPVLPPHARDAGDGPVPAQQAIPPALAAEFLCDDGQAWVPWREVDAVEVLPQLNIFRITHRFARPTATVAMRVPCLDMVFAAYAERLHQAKLPGVQVERIGTTPEHRPLQIIRLDDPTSTRPTVERPTILVVAREHATEHASSWAALGLLTALLEETPEAHALRKDATWLIIPLQDPEGSAHAQFDRMTDRFGAPNDPSTPSEVFAYARYFTDYVYSGRTIDIAVSLHNVEANEGPHLLSPFANQQHFPAVVAANRLLFEAARQRAFQTGNPEAPWERGLASFRLYGWIGFSFGTLDVAFEVNDRYPPARLTLPRLMDLGGAMAAPLRAWCDSPDGQRWHLRQQKLLTVKALERRLYFQRAGYGPAQRTPVDLVIRAY